MAISSNKNNRPKREEYQKKKVKNKKSLRGEPETTYDEIKTPVSFSLTKTGANLIKQKSKELGISASAFLEQIARGEIQVDLAVSEEVKVDSGS